MFQRISFFGLILFLISACGGGGDSTPPASTPTTINSYTISSGGSNLNGAEQINASVNGGEFTTDWSVTAATDPYHSRLYVSADATLSTNTDVQFFGVNCGSGMLHGCNSTASFTCRFTTQNHISCGVLNQVNQGEDLTTFLTGLPEEVYILHQACDGLFSSCVTRAIKVELQ